MSFFQERVCQKLKTNKNDLRISVVWLAELWCFMITLSRNSYSPMKKKMLVCPPRITHTVFEA